MHHSAGLLINGGPLQSGWARVGCGALSPSVTHGALLGLRPGKGDRRRQVSDDVRYQPDKVETAVTKF